MKKYMKWIDNQYGFVEVIPPEKAREIINGVDLEKAIQMAWKGHIPRMRSGYCVLDMIEGKIRIDSLGNNESSQPIDDQTIVLYTIPMDIEFLDEDIFSEEEMESEEWQNWKQEGLDDEEMCEKLGDDSYTDRCIDCLLDQACVDIHAESEDVRDQLKDYYADFEDESSKSYIEEV